MTRQQVIALIKQKEKNAVDALEREVSSDPDALMRKLLADKGIEKGSAELQNERYELRRLREEANIDDDPVLEDLHEKDQDIDTQIEAEIAVAQEAIDAQMNVLRSEFRMRKAAIEATREEREKVVKDAILEREKELLNNVQPGLAERMREIEDEMPKVKQLERQLRMEVNRLSRSIENSRSRLVHLVHDAAVKAQTDLLSSMTQEQAQQALNVIPTVAEMIHIAEDPEGGLNDLVSRLSPSHTLKLTGPTAETSSEESDPEPTNVVDGEVTPVNVVFSRTEAG
jgi:hypothetical protein